MTKTIGILDYGAGNIRSVENALKRIGASYFVSDDIEALGKADKIIFPGVGHAKSAMTQLKATGLDVFLKECKKPVLGICLGMQLLFDFSEEDDVDCLGIIPGKVVRFDSKIVNKIPHMGWNATISSSRPEDGALDQSEWRDLNRNRNFFYFVHSYYVPVSDHTVSTCEYGTQSFSAIVAKDNFIGMQFHPEKSGTDGEQLLKNFCEDGI